MRTFSLRCNALDALSEFGKKYAEIVVKRWQLLGGILVLVLVNWPLCHGAVRSELVFLPEAVKTGQWWRLFLFPLVHLSGYHLLLDAGGFFLVYRSLEEKRLIPKLIYLVIAGAGSLLMALAVDPSISARGLAGLSGVAHGLMAITGLEMLRYSDQRPWGIFYLTVVIGKSAYELHTGQVMFQFMHMGMCGYPVAACHSGGVIGGLVIFSIVQIKEWISRSATDHRPARCLCTRIN